MDNKLKEYFPLIRTREELLAEIESKSELNKTFRNWKYEYQEEFLDFCTGVKGVKILYDSFFKEIMNPEYTPGRLSELISLLIGQNVRVLNVLPNDSTRIADETSLVIMDIVVELEDHSITNIEIQKIGYAFPGQRSACYSSDLLLRQYKRVRGENKNPKKKFSFQNIKPVYTIVFFETSQREFHEFPDTYVHRFKQRSDSGVKLELLQNFLFIPLDIFKSNIQNKNISSKLDAWLAFLCMDEPEWIIRVIEAYPEFEAMYQQIYEMCLNVERVMEMFSKELQELDRNTVHYMIDEMQNEINRMGSELQQRKEELEQKDEELQQRKEELEQKDEELQQSKEELQQSKEELQQSKEELQQKASKIEELMRRISELEGQTAQEIPKRNLNSGY